MKLVTKLALFLIVPLSFLSACSSSFQLGNYDDPYENVNRKSHEINKAIDKKVVRPSSKIYVRALGKKPRSAIANFSVLQTFQKIGASPKILSIIRFKVTLEM